MTTRHYIKRPTKYNAIRWTFTDKDPNGNVNEVIKFLDNLGYEYSYDEIKSGGELVVYVKYVGPKVIARGNWIVVIEDSDTALRGTALVSISDEQFQKLYEEV